MNELSKSTLLGSPMNTIPNSIMSALIVDFPRERNRKVHFSSMSDLWVYERDDGKDKSKIWYSEEEYVRMKLDFKRSILNKYETNISSDGQGQVDATGSARRHEGLNINGQEVDESDDIDLLGPNVVRWVHAHKANHTRAVLEEQERQDRSGESNPSKIASVSQRYSQWSTIRAQSKRHITKSIENEPRG